MTPEVQIKEDVAAAEEQASLPVLNGSSRWVLVGSPNSGKTTVFNALTGLRSKVANYPGVTVDCGFGTVHSEEGRTVEVLDLPGTYSLKPLSPEERLTMDYLTGQIAGETQPDGIIFVAEATTLARSLQLLGALFNLLDLSPEPRPRIVLALTMVDELLARGGRISEQQLSMQLGVPVVRVIGNRGLGIPALKRHLLNGFSVAGPDKAARPSMSATAEERFRWADELLERVYKGPTRGTALTDALDRWTLHPVSGLLTFALVMVVFFQAVFSWAVPMQDGIDAAVGGLSEFLLTTLPEGLLRDLVVNGILAGVGSVVVFVPQIGLLFLLLTFFEQAGYMSRAVFVIDRVMKAAGLDGRSFVALLSSYACAVPGIMATRSIPDFRQRLATIMVAPFMTCSARLPVYTLLIAAFVPVKYVFGFLNLQGLVMLGLYVMGAVTAMLAATFLRRGPLAGQSMPFYIELPPYRWPTLTAIWRGVWTPVRRFLRRAGTIILGVSLVLWVVLTFPRSEAPADVANQGEAAVQAYQLENSLGGQLGKTIEPALEPIGFDWRIGVGLVASLAAREVVVATLAQIYSAESEQVGSLRAVLNQRLAPPGVEAATERQRLAVALSLLVFFIFALQCMSTLAVMRRETGSWKWPALAFFGMFVIAYTASFLAYRITLIL